MTDPDDMDRQAEDAYTPPVITPEDLEGVDKRVLNAMRREAAHALAHKDRVPKPSMIVGWRGVLSMVEDELDQRREERLAKRDNKPIHLHVGIFPADSPKVTQRYAITPEEVDHWSKHTDADIVEDALDRMVDAVAERWRVER